jgi:hypothetical protein
MKLVREALRHAGRATTCFIPVQFECETVHNQDSRIDSGHEFHERFLREMHGAAAPGGVSPSP